MRKCRNGLPVIIDREGQRLPRLRARRTASTFHRRKVDRKAAGGPLYQGRNAPRSPPFALSEDGFCCTPAPRLPRGFALPLRGTGNKKAALSFLTKRLRGAIVVSVRTAAIAVAVVPNRFLVRRDRRLPLWWAVISYA